MPMVHFGDLLRALKEEHERQELLISNLSKENRDLKACSGCNTEHIPTPRSEKRAGTTKTVTVAHVDVSRTPSSTSDYSRSLRSVSASEAATEITRILNSTMTPLDVADPALQSASLAIATQSRCFRPNASTKARAVDNNINCRTHGSMAMVIGTFYASLAQDPEAYWLRGKALELLTKGAKFESFIGCIIMINSALIGLEGSLQVQGRDTSWIQAVEAVFLLIYCLELCMRIYVYRLKVFKSYWVRFDALLVVTGLFTSVSEALHSHTVMQQVMILRVLRVFRLARALRLLVQFRRLWQLVGGLLSSCQTIVYSFVLLFVLLYVFACVALEIITMHPLAMPGTPNEEFRRIVEVYFYDLHICMLTLIQFVNLDSIGVIYGPLVHADHRLIWYFVAFFMFVPVTMMNLITAVIVESSRDQVEADKEVQRKHRLMQVRKIIPFLGDLFRSLDKDGSGYLSKDELQDASQELQAQLKDWLNVDDIQEIFDVIDADGSGEVSVDEFCEEISRHFCTGKPLEFTRIMKHLKLLRGDINSVTSDIGQMQSSIDALEKAEQVFHKQVENKICNGNTTAEREENRGPLISVTTAKNVIDL